MRTNKITIFHPTDSSSGLQVAKACPTLRAQGGTHPGQDTLPSRDHSHVFTLRQGQCSHANWPHCTSSGCGRNLQFLEKTHTDVGRTDKLHTVVPARNWFFFLSHQCHNKVTLKEAMLFEKLLYNIITFTEGGFQCQL